MYVWYQICACRQISRVFAGDDMNDNKKTERSYHIVGWVLFIVCALLFIGASIDAGDAVMGAGSVIFLVACIVFLIPLVRGGNRS